MYFKVRCFYDTYVGFNIDVGIDCRLEKCGKMAGKYIFELPITMSTDGTGVRWTH